MLPVAAPLVLLSSLLQLVHALGDFPCAGTSDSQSCALWSTDKFRQGNISATAVCQPDPIHPTVSYCGYANAACSTNLDCDYGSCGPNGTCTGYLGDACPNGPIDCQAFFFCGTDGMCGSAGAPCANSDAVPAIPAPNDQCVSNSCDLTTMTCNAPPLTGVPVGFGCGTAEVCASGFCSSGNTCQIRVVASTTPTVPAPSGVAATASKKRKRFYSDGKEVIACDKSLESCRIGSWGSLGEGEGYECIDSKTNLEQCGGCSSVQPAGYKGVQGQDCAAILGVEGVLCQGGHCLILSCRPGLEISTNGHSCVQVGGGSSRY